MKRCLIVCCLIAAIFSIVADAQAGTITGTFRYNDLTPGSTITSMRPITHIKVEIWSFRPRVGLTSTWAVEATTTTDGNGKISVDVPNMAASFIYAIRVLAANDACDVAGYFYKAAWPSGQEIQRTATAANSILDFPTDIVDPDAAQYFNVAETLQYGRNYVLNLRDPAETDKLEAVGVFPRLTGGTSFFNPSQNHLELNWDDFYRDLSLLHEYGHFVAAQLSSLAWIASDHSGCDEEISGKWIQGDTEVNLSNLADSASKNKMKQKHAWLEGFADFFALAVARKLPSGTLTGVINTLETPACATKSENIENVVGGILWDLVDEPIDPGSSIETFDNVKDMDREVFQIFDRELDVYGLWPRLGHFCNAWFSRGFDANGLISIADALNVKLVPWTPYHQMGSEKTLGAPTAVSWGSNRIDIFVQGTDQSLYTKSWDGSQWSNYTRLGSEKIMGTPTAVSWGPNRIDVFVQGTDQSLYTKSWNGSQWSNYTRLGSEKIVGTPTVVSWGPNRIDVFVQGTDQSLYTKSWNGSQWSNYTRLGSQKIIGKPAAVCWAPNRIDVFVHGTNHSLYTKSWNGSQWNNYSQLGSNQILGTPAVVTRAPNRIDVFVQGTDQSLYTKSWNGANWSNYIKLSSETLMAPPTVISWGTNRIDVFGQGTDQTLYTTSWNGSQWSNFTQLGIEKILVTPAAVSWSPNRIDVFVQGTDYAIYTKSRYIF